MVSVCPALDPALWLQEVITNALAGETGGTT